MKKSFRLGLSVFIPVAVVIIVFYWLYNIVTNLLVSLFNLFLPGTIPYRWWYVFPFLLGIYIIIVVSGFMLSKFKVLQWIKTQWDKLIKKFPMVGNVYDFGLEIADTLIDDGKFDGSIKVVEFDWNDHMIGFGLLTDAQNHLITSATTPNPTNGFLFKVHPDHYQISNMTVEQYMKLVISMGKLNGWLARRKFRKALENKLPFTDLPVTCEKCGAVMMRRKKRWVCTCGSWKNE